MIYKNLSHVSILVSNIDRAKKFYGETLGLEEIERPDFGFPGAWYRLDSQVELHLIVPPDGHVWPSFVPESAFRFPHFALWSEDINGTLDRLNRQGCKVNLNEAIEGVRQIFVFDEDQNMIEFLGRS